MTGITVEISLLTGTFLLFACAAKGILSTLHWNWEDVSKLRSSHWHF